MNLRLVYILSGLYFVSILYSMPSNAANIIYYFKDSDGGVIESEIKDLPGVENFITVPGTTYYIERSLPTNAILCGEQADPDLALEILGKLQANIDIYYFGQFYRKSERNGSQDVVDIRSINTPEITDRYAKLRREDFDGVDKSNLCGYGNTVEIWQSVLDRDGPVEFSFKELDSYEYSQMLGQIYKNKLAILGKYAKFKTIDAGNLFTLVLSING